jgi:hypothetical protein
VGSQLYGFPSFPWPVFTTANRKADAALSLTLAGLPMHSLSPNGIIPPSQERMKNGFVFDPGQNMSLQEHSAAGMI